MNAKLQSLKEFFKVIILGLVVVAILIGGGVAFSWWQAQQPASCNVAVAQLYGTLVYYPAENSGAAASANGDGTLDQTAAEDIRAQIEAADADPNIKAILLQVDSPGGDPVAGEDIADALKQSSKPTVAFVADEGTSAAYWASTGAQTIFASADSALADIGVTESYLDDAQQNENNGLTFESLTAGEYKDMGNPDAPLTPAEKALFERDLNITLQNFIEQVAANRNLSVASVTAIADGFSMEGEMALQDGLIDHIGSIYDVENYLKGKIGTDPVLCD
jgi:protease IV